MRFAQLAGLGMLAVALAACGGGGAPEGTSDPRPTPSKAPLPDFSGVASFHGVSVVFMDPRTGATKFEIAVPEYVQDTVVEEDNLRRRFAPDWQWLVWPDEGTLRLAKLNRENGLHYREVATLEPGPGSFQVGKADYRQPRFSPDGTRLWFEAIYESGETKLLSVALAAPEQRPRDEGTVKRGYLEPQLGGRDWPYEVPPWLVGPQGKRIEVQSHTAEKNISGDGSVTIAYAATSDRVLDVEVAVSEDLSDRYDDVEYETVAAVDERTVLMLGDDTGNKNRYGQIASATVTGDGKVTLRKIVPNASTEVGDVAVSPDGKTLLMQDGNGNWFRGSTDGTGQPRRAFSTEYGDILGWAGAR